MFRRIAATAASAAIGALALTAGLTSPATAAPPPRHHGHLMLIGAEWTGSGPTTVVTSFRHCVTLAAGEALPMNAHHSNVHRGRAGEALAEAGNLVVPLAPLSPYTGCASFEK